MTNLFCYRAASLSATLWILAAGCAGPGTEKDPRDPLEPVNRVTYRVNGFIDGIVIKPASQLYTFFAPEPVEKGVKNFLQNVAYVDTILNDFLQGKFGQCGRDLTRFVVNTTAGVGGLFDVASSIGLARNKEDFGQTLAAWGVGPGPFLVVPIFGPRNLRDVPAIVFAVYTSPIPYVAEQGISNALWALTFVDRRSRVDPDFERRNREAQDPYAFTREAWWQHREFEVHAGEPAEDQEALEKLLDEVEELEQLEELEELDALEEREELEEDGADVPDKGPPPAEDRAP